MHFVVLERASIILDVGCGSNPIGHVNVDPWNPKTVNPKKYHWLNRKRIPNFVLAVGEYLPFRNNIFDLVEARGSVEHSEKPQQFMLEMIRVSKHQVRFSLPHRFSKHVKYHLHYFTRSYLKREFQKLQRKQIILGYRFEQNVTYRYFPGSFLLLIRLPSFIFVMLYIAQ